MHYQAFVSSTYEDLKRHRAFVIKVLRRAGIFVDPMEDWQASSDEPQYFSVRRLEGCDLCVLLVAFRRGFIPSGESESITQKEYREAIRLGIPVLAFILDEKARWPRAYNELNEDPQVRVWREELRGKHGTVRFRTEPKSLPIAESIARWLTERSPGHGLPLPDPGRAIPLFPEPAPRGEFGDAGDVRAVYRDEWIVTEAREHEKFLTQMRCLYDLLLRRVAGIGTDVVITLYARSLEVFGDAAVGHFAYDLIYYRNVRDDAPMFGPVVKDDDRQKFAEGEADREIGVAPQGKHGGFVQREEIFSYAKFKLTRGADKTRPDLVGLLYVNGRKGTIPVDIFDTHEFEVQVRTLAVSVAAIRDRRKVRYNDKAARILDNPLGAGLNTRTPTAMSKVFSDLVRIAGYQDTVFSAYLYVETPKPRGRRLKWLWSNQPTGAPAVLRLEPVAKRDRDIPLLVTDVARDPNNKPLLVHGVRNKAGYEGKVIRTSLGDLANVDLVIPVLSKRGAHLLGVLDVQGSDPAQFGTDDVQLLYALSRLNLSDAFEKLQHVNTEARLPLHTGDPYEPFEKQPLEFAIEDLLALEFNSMKFLLHWDNIRELVTTNATSVPASVEVWPTMRCNHRCAWCRVRLAGRILRRDMSAKELQGIAEDLNALDGVDVLISGGGEPLLHPAIHTFMEAICGVSGTVGIFTNGTRPRDFRFWESFFRCKDRHRFVRVSFNGHDPESYCRVHFDLKEGDPLLSDYRERYAEARKIVLDLLGLRSPRVSIAIGDTVDFEQRQHATDKARHAEALGVDFIQMRPELVQSTQSPAWGRAVCTAVEEARERHHGRDDFAIVYTDGERSFADHDEPRCYAMQLVPTLVPDSEEGWTRVLPCSYAINRGGTTPILGRMREGARLSEFWKEMNRTVFSGADSRGPANASDSAHSDYEVEVRAPIDPTKGCPQCRYYRLNKRIQSIAAAQASVHLIDALVEALGKNPRAVSTDLRRAIGAVWQKETIDVTDAQVLFEKSRQLGLVPSL